MAKSMTKSQIADYVAQKTGLTKKAAVQLMDDFAALAYQGSEERLRDTWDREARIGEPQGTHGTEPSDW